MALASAGCEMPSSSYTAGPRPQLPGLWAAELASVASTQALQRDGWRDCEAGGSGRRGWARARNRLARSAGGCARARRARAWQAEQAERKVRPSQNSNLRAFVVGGGRPLSRPRVTCARINVSSGLHYRNKFLR